MRNFSNIFTRRSFFNLLNMLQKRWWLAICLFAFIVLASAIYLVLSCPSVDYLVRHNPSTTSFIEHRKRQGRIPKRFASLKKSWIPLSRIPELLRKTVLVAEDGGFYQHDGVDWYEVKQAMQKNIERGRIVRGASTITQQLAKNLFLSAERSLFRKIREWLLALKLEKHLSKSRILELYLNCIEYGPKIFGLSAATRRFFGKSPEKLSLSEMVRLSAVIPKPLSLDPTKPSEGLAHRSQMILDRLLNYGYIDQDTHRQTAQSLEYFFDPETHPTPEELSNQTATNSNIEDNPIEDQPREEIIQQKDQDLMPLQEPPPLEPTDERSDEIPANSKTTENHDQSLDKM